MRAGQGPSHRCCRRHRPPGAAGAQRRLRTASLLQADWPACTQLSVQRLEAEREQFGGEGSPVVLVFSHPGFTACSTSRQHQGAMSDWRVRAQRRASGCSSSFLLLRLCGAAKPSQSCTRAFAPSQSGCGTSQGACPTRHPASMRSADNPRRRRLPAAAAAHSSCPATLPPF